MKTTFLMLAAAALICAGCGDNSKQSKVSQAVSNTVTAPVNYLDALNKGKQSAEKTIDVVQVNQAVMYYNEAEGHFPKDLNELVAKHYLGKIPEAPYGMKLVYNAETGEVKVVKQ